MEAPPYAAEVWKTNLFAFLEQAFLGLPLWAVYGAAIEEYQWQRSSPLGCPHGDPAAPSLSRTSCSHFLCVDREAQGQAFHGSAHLPDFVPSSSLPLPSLSRHTGPLTILWTCQACVCLRAGCCPEARSWRAEWLLPSKNAAPSKNPSWPSSPLLSFIFFLMLITTWSDRSQNLLVFSLLNTWCASSFWYLNYSFASIVSETEEVAFKSLVKFKFKAYAKPKLILSSPFKFLGYAKT